MDFLPSPLFKGMKKGWVVLKRLSIDWRVMPNATHSGSFAASQGLETTPWYIFSTTSPRRADFSSAIFFFASHAGRALKRKKRECTLRLENTENKAQRCKTKSPGALRKPKSTAESFALGHKGASCGVFGRVALIIKETAVLKRHGVTPVETADSP